MHTSKGCVWNWEMLGFWICNRKQNSRCTKFKEHSCLKFHAMLEKVSYVWFDQGHTSQPRQDEGKKIAILIVGLEQLCKLMENYNQTFKEGEPHSSLTASKPWGRTQSPKRIYFWGKQKQTNNQIRTKRWFYCMFSERRLTELSIPVMKIFPAPDWTQKHLSQSR